MTNFDGRKKTNKEIYNPGNTNKQGNIQARKHSQNLVQFTRSRWFPEYETSGVKGCLDFLYQISGRGGYLDPNLKYFVLRNKF